MLENPAPTMKWPEGFSVTSSTTSYSSGFCAGSRWLAADPKKPRFMTRFSLLRMRDSS